MGSSRRCAGGQADHAGKKTTAGSHTGPAQSRRLMKYQCGELRPRSLELTLLSRENGPCSFASFKRGGQGPYGLRTHSGYRATSSNPSPPLGRSCSHARRAAKAEHSVVSEDVRSSRPLLAGPTPGLGAQSPEWASLHSPTDLARDRAKRHRPEAVLTSSVRGGVTARGILATAGHLEDVGARS